MTSCRKQKGRALQATPAQALEFSYFSELLIDVNLALRLVPRPFTAARMTIEIPAAISPYSMAVAPASSRQNFKTAFFMVLLRFLWGGRYAFQMRS
jgi:hypothetical protein